MKQYNITGMSCAACVSRVEKAVSAVEGVENCSVSLLTNSMGVEGNATDSQIIDAVRKAGYDASAKMNRSESSDASHRYEEELEDRETPALRRRLIASLIIMLPLMYVSMGHMMWGFPVPGFLSDNCLAIGIYELVLSALVMVINQKFFIKGFIGLVHKAPNMDTLVAMGSGTSFVYSLAALFAMTEVVDKGDKTLTMQYMDSFYFETAAMILTLITVGKMLEARSKGKTTDALKGLMKLAPSQAVLIVDDKEITVSTDKIKKGDIFAVKPGESIPVDGIVISGNSAVNESSITGESIPIDKSAGDEVVSATINQSGYLVCEATKVGEDTTISKIIKMVSDAAATKAPIAKLADKVSGVFVPVVLAIAVITFLVWLLCGENFGFAIARAVSVLVISCPCALGLATPVAIMVGNGLGAKNGILFKTAASLEMTGEVNIIALDKTGTITKGEPSVSGIYPANGVSEAELLSYAYSLERKSEHPLAGAIVSYCEQNDISAPEVTDFLAVPGSGLRGNIEGTEVLGGNLKYLRESAERNFDEFKDTADRVTKEGCTPLYFSKNGEPLGVISVSDIIKEDSSEAVSELRELGLHVVMITGDNVQTAKAIGTAAGVDEVAAGIRPDGKESIIRELQKYGRVAMVGDGINDAPALTSADIGIAIGAGTDIAIDAAEIVLMKSSLKDVAAAIRLSRATLRNIKQNLFWAFFYNIIGIPLAAGVYVKAFGLTMNPMYGAAAMSLSSFFVVTNALRLNLFDLYKRKIGKRKAITGALLPEIAENEKTEDTIMKIEVKGMMCMHCEKHVKTAVEKIDGVTEASASHENGTVDITTSKDIDINAVKAVIEDAGYEFVGIL